MAFLIFYVTHPDESVARQIAKQVVEKRLVACANVFPIQSIYWWDGEVQHEGEWVSILKTSLELEAEVEQALRALHPYQTPCFLRFEVRANEDYERWIHESTTKAS
ncbi:MAG: divalent-cation tolerance protein CutA [Saprospiraceae bacterium]|nr:divalent-cation tolerance protein CutA [Saprospiraceae bacterium]MDW8483730.1 divalent-cation tolerance protein CutA [Saprospiraceae bacterium]